MSGLGESHIFTAEMQKQIRSAAHEEARPRPYLRACPSETLPLFERRNLLKKNNNKPKLCFDDLLYYVNGVPTSVAAFTFFYGSFGKMSFERKDISSSCAREENTQCTQ